MSTAERCRLSWETKTAAVFSLSEMVDALTIQGPYIPRH